MIHVNLYRGRNMEVSGFGFSWDGIFDIDVISHAIMRILRLLRRFCRFRNKNYRFIYNFSGYQLYTFMMHFDNLPVANMPMIPVTF